MVKTILIPIDFSIESLNTLKYALEQNKQEKFKIVLFYAETLSTSISDLLFYSPIKRIQELSTPKFKDAIHIIKNTYESNIQQIRIELFHGYNKNAFLNFHEGFQIDLVYLPANYRLTPKQRGFDPIPLIKKSKVLFNEVNWSSDKRNSNDDELNQLFK